MRPAEAGQEPASLAAVPSPSSQPGPSDAVRTTAPTRRSAQSGVVCPDRHRKTWLRIRAVLREVPMDQELVTEAAWDDLIELWQGMTKEVTKANKAWLAVGESLSNARFAAKTYDAVEFTPKQDGTVMPKPGVPVPEWERKRHPDEYIAVQLVFNAEKGMQENRIVRYVPGDDSRLDAARAEYKTWLSLREQGAREFVNAHRTNKQ